MRLAVGIGQVDVVVHELAPGIHHARQLFRIRHITLAGDEDVADRARIRRGGDDRIHPIGEIGRADAGEILARGIHRAMRQIVAAAINGAIDHLRRMAGRRRRAGACMARAGIARHCAHASRRRGRQHARRHHRAWLGRCGMCGGGVGGRQRRWRVQQHVKDRRLLGQPQGHRGTGIVRLYSQGGLAGKGARLGDH